MRFIRLPKSALRKRTASQSKPALGSMLTAAGAAPADPLLYNSASDYNNDGDVDGLWLFPTIGFASPSTVPLYGIPNTLEAGAAAPNNTADVSLGELGGPAQVTQLVIYGAMADATTFAFKSGDVFILMFDGVDQSLENAPVFQGNSATLRDMGTDGQPIDGYVVHFDVADKFYSWIVDTSANPYVIHDPQGRFGLLVAKYADGSTPTTTQWVGLVNSPNGGNAVWQLTNGDFSTVALEHFAAPSDFNQGANNFGVYNYFFEVHGKNGDASAAQRGTLMGSIRRQGINPPPVPPDTAVAESGPGAYLVIAHDPNNSDPTTNVVRQDYLFTQPSYTSNGTLTINYRLEGYPAGTYNFEIRQVPIADADGNLDTVWDPTSYPFGDFVPAMINGVTIANGGTTKLSARLERLGDITGPDGVRDGVVGPDDLTPFALSFFLTSVDPDFNPDADLVGIDGPPDGSVDGFDLTAFALEFFLGNFEEQNYTFP